MKEVEKNLAMANVYDFILKMYVKNVNVHEDERWKTVPFFIGEKAIALNDHEACFFDKEYVNNLFACGFNTPEKILSTINTQPNMLFALPIDLINQALDKIPMVKCFDVIGSDIECSECDGSGEVEWEYKNYKEEFDCPKCKGSGFSSKSYQKHNGNFKKEEGYYIDIKNSRFNALYIEKLVVISQLLKSEITLNYQCNENKANFFSILDINVLIMPVLKTGTQDSEERVLIKI